MAKFSCVKFVSVWLGKSMTINVLSTVILLLIQIKQIFRLLFTKQTYCNQLTRLQINIVMLTYSPFPHDDVEFNKLFIELRGDHEKKAVMGLWLFQPATEL